MIEIFHDFHFEAALRLPNLPADHPCGRTHGHSFRARITLRGEPDPHFGWVRDFGDVQSAFEPLRQQLDHSLLNEVDGLQNPTSENLARWILDRLRPTLPELHSVTLQDTHATGVKVVTE